MFALVYCVEQLSFLASFVLKFSEFVLKFSEFVQKLLLVPHHSPAVTCVHALHCNVDMVCSQSSQMTDED